jgi:hypothetical protein
MTKLEGRGTYVVHTTYFALCSFIPSEILPNFPHVLVLIIVFGFIIPELWRAYEIASG